MAFFKTGGRISAITKKIVLLIIFTGLILGAVTLYASYWSFTHRFRERYDATIQSICAAARECLPVENFDTYLSTHQSDAAYDDAMRILQDFVNKFELNMLYVSKVDGPDYTHITYLFNPVSLDGTYTAFPLGYEEEYVEPEFNGSAKKVFEKGEAIIRHTYKTRSGSHITAMLPVYNASGKIVAVVGAQKSIQEFIDAQSSFLNVILLISIVSVVSFFALFTVFFDRQFVHPLRLLTQETKRFASSGGEPDEAVKRIKNKDEIGDLSQSVIQMEEDIIRNVRELFKVSTEKERMATELSVASRIQLELLPTDYPPFPERHDFDLFASMSPAKEVGGDLYDYILLDDDHLMLVVGDVSGKGVPAALFMVVAKTLIASYATQGLSPSAIFEKTNKQLCAGNESNLFVTCWLGLVTLSTGKMRFVNAGHPAPVLYHDGAFSFLKIKADCVLGVFEETHFTEHEITLSKGDRLFVYTDGVTEATNASDVLFGEERLMTALEGTQDLDAPRTIRSVRKHIDRFVSEAEQFDDITMLSFVLPA